MVTYSIVARDSDTGELGVAVQSCMLGAGGIAPWARPGVGAVATQGFADPSYGPHVLDTLATGVSAPRALAAAVAADAGADLRQASAVSAAGTTAAHTGPGCIAHAGHQFGTECVSAANMAAAEQVWPAMAEAFTATAGALPRRLLTALEAAQAAGGDGRGVMAAAVLTVQSQPHPPGAGRLVDLRIERSKDPLAELHRLLDAHAAYTHNGQALDALASGDTDRALALAETALAHLPGEENLRFTRASVLLGRGNNGDIARAQADLQALVAGRPSWETIIRSFAAQGLVPLPPSTSLDSLLT